VLLREEAAVSEQMANSLAAAITEFLKERFLLDRIEPEQVDHSSEELLKIAAAYLDERAIGAFATALEKGNRPGPGES
jgi:hypothetical protein